ncbi:MAG TPA: DUF427 domain-containing protein, partial [Micrococcaceae bacterium]
MSLREHSIAMAIRVSEALFALFPQLRFEPTAKRVRARFNGTPVADSRQAVIVWEPQRVTPVFAVPEADILGVLTPVEAAEAQQFPAAAASGAPPVLDPRTGFRQHTAAGTELSLGLVSAADTPGLEGAAFRLADPALEGYIALDFRPFSWLEDDQATIGHPRDPFHRIDIRTSTAHRRIQLGNTVLADTRDALLLYETSLPVRTYIPRGGVRTDIL